MKSIIHFGCVNIKMSSYQCRDSHYEDKTVSPPSYIHDGNIHTWKDDLYTDTELWSSISQGHHEPESGDPSVISQEKLTWLSLVWITLNCGFSTDRLYNDKRLYPNYFVDPVIYIINTNPYRSACYQTGLFLHGVCLQYHIWIFVTNKYLKRKVFLVRYRPWHLNIKMSSDQYMESPLKGRTVCLMTVLSL